MYEPLCRVPCSVATRNRSGEDAPHVVRREHGLAEAYVPVAGREHLGTSARRRVSPDHATQELVVDELDHSLARSLSPKPRRARLQSSSVTVSKELAPKLVHSTRNEDQRIPDVEIADLPASVEAPAVPSRSGKAHLTPVGNPNVTGVGHGASVQGNNNVCIVEPLLAKSRAIAVVVRVRPTVRVPPTAGSVGGQLAASKRLALRYCPGDVVDRELVCPL